MEIVFKGGLIDCWPNILDRIKYVEVLRKCNNSTPEEYHQALYDEGLVISTKINFSMFDGFSTEYNMMSQGIDIDALYQQSWETWSDSLKFATSMWLFGVSDSYCKELARWDYSIDYKLSLEEEINIQHYVEYVSKHDIVSCSNKTVPSFTESKFPPKGEYAPETSRGNIRQNETGDLFATKGYNITMLKEENGGNGYGIKPTTNQDFIIEGNVFDCYSPNSDDIANICREITKKTKSQATRIVLNLNDFDLTKLDELIRRIYGKTTSNGDLKNLQELIIVKGEEIITTFVRY